jgi:hypothetical protein
MIIERFRIDFHYLSLAYYASDWLIHLDICMSIRSIMGVNPGGMGRVHPVFGVEGGEYLITPPQTLFNMFNEILFLGNLKT